MKILLLSFAIVVTLAGCSSDDKAPDEQSEAEAGETEQGTGGASSPVDNEPTTTTDDPPSSPADNSPATTTDDPADSSTDGTTATTTDDPPSSTTDDSSPTTISEPPAPPQAPTTDDQSTPIDDQQTTTTDNTPTTGTSTIISQLVNPVDDTGAALTGWDCLNQDDEQVAFFVFLGDGSGSVQTSADGNEIDITWSEDPDNSILMSVASSGDSQLQSLAFSDPETFTTTDSSIAGDAPGPLSCKLADLQVSSQDDQSENVPQTALDKAKEDALSIADGSEASAADIISTLPDTKWSCTVATEDSDNNYTIELLADGSGFLSEFPIAWSTVDDIPGLVALSVTESNDGAIGGITIENSNYFTAAFGRFGDTYVVPDGLVECSR